jgi:hypothetical protein
LYSIFHIEGGVGKNIAATNVVRNIKKTYPDRKLVVVSPYPEIFVHNPYVYRVYKTGLCPYFYEDFIQDKDSLVFKHEPYNSNEVINRKCSLAQAWCKSLDLEFDENKPELYFNNIEKQNSQVIFNSVNNGKPVIALQINGGISDKKNQINFNWFRDLPPMYAQNLVNKYSEKFHFVQIKNPGQIALEGVQQVDLNIREILLLLSQCKGAVAIDSLVQHAMAAFNKPSLVFWIGNSPVVYGYEMHSNLTATVPCSDNLESYLDPYPLNTQGHQCPSNYRMIDLFDSENISETFEKLFKV